MWLCFFQGVFCFLRGMCARRARFKLLICSRLLVQSCPKLYSKVLLCPPSTSRSMGVNTYNNLMPRASNRPCLFFLAPQRHGATRRHFSWEPRLEKCQGQLASGWGSALCLPRLTGKRTCPVAVQYLSNPAFRISSGRYNGPCICVLCVCVPKQHCSVRLSLQLYTAKHIRICDMARPRQACSAGTFLQAVHCNAYV